MTIKTIYLTLSLLATPLFMQTAHAEAADPVQSQNQNSSQSVILAMQNMTCAMCKFTIKKALQGVEGVQKVSVDGDTKMADVTFDPRKTGIEALIKATTNAGYPATARDGGSVAIGREPMRPTARDGGSVAIGREPMRPTARDGGRDGSRQSSAFPPSMEVRSVAIGTTARMQEVEQRREQLPREPMRPTARDGK